MIEFYNCANYRGCLQAKKTDKGKYYWRVDCDLEDTLWVEIPEYLWTALEKYRAAEYGTASYEESE